MDRARGVRRRRRPRHAAVERPVDLDRAGSSSKRRMAAHGPRREVRGVHQPAVEVGRSDVGEHRAGARRSAHRRSCARRSPGRRSTVDPRRPPRSSGSRRRATRTGAPAPGSARRRRPAGTGKPTVWPSMTSSTPMSPEPGASQRDVGVPGVAGEQQPRRRRRRTGREPSSAAGVSSMRTKSSPPTLRSRASGAQPGPDRRERREQGLDELVADPVPLARTASSQASPSPGCCSSMQRGGDVAVAVQERPRPVRAGWPSTAGACRHTRPCSSRWNDRIVGEAAASG